MTPHDDGDPADTGLAVDLARQAGELLVRLRANSGVA